MVIMCLPILPFFIVVAIFYPSSHRYKVPEVSQSTHTSPIIKGCFSLVHMIKLCLKLCSWT